MCLKLMAKIAACPSKISQPSAVGGGVRTPVSDIRIPLLAGSFIRELDQTIISRLNFNSNPLNSGKHFEKRKLGTLESSSRRRGGGGDKFWNCFASAQFEKWTLIILHAQLSVSPKERHLDAGTWRDDLPLHTTTPWLLGQNVTAIKTHFAFF